MIDWVWIRPEWLWALIPWLIITISFAIYRPKQAKWHKLIAPHLQTQLVKESGQSKNPTPWLMLSLLLAVIAMAGPSFRTQDTPLYSTEQARVLILDMSLSMWATDVKPNRLTRLRYKAMDYVNASKGGEMGLIAYAGDAFTVSPMTSDGKTLNNLISALSPEVMPAFGSRPDIAIKKAVELLKQAGHQQGSLVMMTDGIKESRADAIREILAPTGYKLSIYQVGTEVGAPIKLPSGELLKQGGKITLPTADHDIARALAAETGGILVSMSHTNSDIERLAKASEQAASSSAERQQQTAQIREDAGPFLLLLIAPLFLMLFRKGAIAAFALVVLYQPQPANAFEWQDLWQTHSQQAQQAFDQGDFESAAKLFNDPLRKGAALYRNKDFEGAKSEFEKLDTATGHYNRGNTLAQLQQLDEAIKAYEKALELEPDFADAKRNKEELEKLKQQQQNQQQNQNQNQDNQQQQDQNQQDQNGSDQNQQQQDSEKSSEQNSDQDSNQEQNSEQPKDQQESDQNSNQSDEQQQPNNSQQDQSGSDPSEQKQSEQQQNSSADEESGSEQDQSQLQQDLAQQNQTEQEQQRQEATRQQQAQQQESEEQPSEEQQGPVVSAQQGDESEGEEAQPVTDNRLEALPDNPAILLRNKMQLEYQKRQAEGTLVPEDEVW